MCEFANPWVLLLALLVPVLVAWWLRRPRRSLRYSDTGVLTGLPEGRSRVARWGGAGLRAAGLLPHFAASHTLGRARCHARLKPGPGQAREATGEPNSIQKIPLIV